MTLKEFAKLLVGFIVFDAVMLVIMLWLHQAVT